MRGDSSKGKAAGRSGGVGAVKPVGSQMLGRAGKFRDAGATGSPQEDDGSGKERIGQRGGEERMREQMRKNATTTIR